MFENIVNFFKRFGKNDKENSSIAAKERLHLVLAQDRANISADFLELMKQEIIDVIKKYIDIDEEAMDVRMTNKAGEDGIIGAPALYANIPIVTIKNEARKLEGTAIDKNQNIVEMAKEIDIDSQIEEKVQEDMNESDSQTKETSNTNTEQKEENIEEVKTEKEKKHEESVAKKSKEKSNNKK